MEEVSLAMIKEASDNMKDLVQVSPIVTSNRLSPNLFFKAENTQRTGSFKIRGAYNRIRMLSDDEAKRGVIACSAGNHAQGVALAASKRGIKSVICMPKNAPEMKIDATRHYGAEVVLVDGNYDKAAVESERLVKENGYIFVHPFDDPYVIAGQGTIGLEIIDQVPDVEQVVVPIGGGGLISGIAVAIKTLKPKCKVIGVEPETVASMRKSLDVGKIVTINDGVSVADGLHVLTPGKITFEMVKKYVDDVVTVDEEMICAAVTGLLECPKLVAEGAGATSTAAFLFGKVDRSKKTVAIVSGGNVDLIKLAGEVEFGINKFIEYTDSN